MFLLIKKQITAFKMSMFGYFTRNQGHFNPYLVYPDPGASMSVWRNSSPNRPPLNTKTIIHNKSDWTQIHCCRTVTLISAERARPCSSRVKFYVYCIQEDLVHDEVIEIKPLKRSQGSITLSTFFHTSNTFIRQKI